MQEPKIKRYQFKRSIDMQKAGGIIALIAGIFGFIAALVTLMAGGLTAGLEGAAASLDGTAVDNTASDAIATFGLLGVLFSFLTIIFGAVAMGAKTKVTGYLLIGSSVGGIFTGGTLVAVCMVLALVGGILATIGAGKT